MIKKAEDLVIGDRIVGVSGDQLGEVKNVSRGEDIVGATVRYERMDEEGEFYLNYPTWTTGTEVFVAVPAQPADWSTADPADRLGPTPNARVDDFLREHTGQVEAIRREPGHIPTQFPQ